MTDAEPSSELAIERHVPFGRRLLTLRLEHGLSQAELAGEILSPSAVALLEAGRGEPTLRVLKLLANRLACSVGYLKYGSERPAEDSAHLELLHSEIEIRGGATPRALSGVDALLAHPGLADDLRDHARLLRALALEALSRPAEALAEVDQLSVSGRDGSMPWLEIDVVRSRCYLLVAKFDDCRQLATKTAAAAESLGLTGTANYFELLRVILVTLYSSGNVQKALKLSERYLDMKINRVPEANAEAYRHGSRHASASVAWREAVALADRALVVLEARAAARAAAKLRVTAAGGILSNSSEPPPERVRRALLEAHRTLLHLGVTLDRSHCEINLAMAERQIGNHTAGIRWALRGLDCLPHTSAALTDYGTLLRAKAHLTLAGCYLDQGDTTRSARHTGYAEETLESLPFIRPMAPVWSQLARLYRALGAPDAALHAYEQTIQLAGLSSMVP